MFSPACPVHECLAHPCSSMAKLVQTGATGHRRCRCRRRPAVGTSALTQAGRRQPPSVPLLLFLHALPAGKCVQTPSAPRLCRLPSRPSLHPAPRLPPPTSTLHKSTLLIWSAIRLHFRPPPPPRSDSRETRPRLDAEASSPDCRQAASVQPFVVRRHARMIASRSSPRTRLVLSLPTRLHSAFSRKKIKNKKVAQSDSEFLVHKISLTPFWQQLTRMLRGTSAPPGAEKAFQTGLTSLSSVFKLRDLPPAAVGDLRDRQSGRSSDTRSRYTPGRRAAGRAREQSRLVGRRLREEIRCCAGRGAFCVKAMEEIRGNYSLLVWAEQIREPDRRFRLVTTVILAAVELSSVTCGYLRDWFLLPFSFYLFAFRSSTV